MIDFFGRKAQKEITRLTFLLAEANNDRADLAHTLRKQDQLIFNMAQKTDWPSMRPIFQELCESANVRMVSESKRITNILIPELIRTYSK